MSEMENRQKLALQVIREQFGNPEAETGVTLFVTHHLDELDSAYWLKHFGKEKPSPDEVLASLVPIADDEEDEEDPDLLDFTLPGGVTNYLLAVAFDEDGEVEMIMMES